MEHQGYHQHQASKCDTFQHNPIERPAVDRLERAGGEHDLLLIIFNMLLMVLIQRKLMLMMMILTKELLL